MNLRRFIRYEIISNYDLTIDNQQISEVNTNTLTIVIIAACGTAFAVSLIVVGIITYMCIKRRKRHYKQIELQHKTLDMTNQVWDDTANLETKEVINWSTL